MGERIFRPPVYADSRTVTLPLDAGMLQSVVIDGERAFFENAHRITRKRAEVLVKLCLLPTQVDAHCGRIDIATAQEEAAKIRAVLGD